MVNDADGFFQDVSRCIYVTLVDCKRSLEVDSTDGHAKLAIFAPDKNLILRNLHIAILMRTELIVVSKEVLQCLTSHLVFAIVYTGMCGTCD